MSLPARLRDMVSRVLRIVHLTDTHFLRDGALHHGYDTQAACNRVLQRLDALPGVQMVVVSGDVSEDGSTQSYEQIWSTVRAWADRHHVGVVWAMGNHDQRGAFREVLIAHSHQPDVLGEMQAEQQVRLPARAGQGQPPIYGRLDFAGVRVIVLDTSVPAHGYGEVGSVQLQWLREVLAEPNDQPFGSVLVMHHPPVPAPSLLLRSLGLRDARSLAETVQGSDIRVILSGHHHLAQFSVLPGTGIPVCVGAPVTAQADMMGPVEQERAVTGSGATVIDVTLGDDRNVAVRCFPVTAPSAADGHELFTLDEDAVRQISAESGMAEGQLQG